jgi:glutamate N-acetyltransferase/amino-acid N-acetyltransferase
MTNSQQRNLPSGFRWSGVSCGIKPSGRDLALVVTDQPGVAAGVYTTNVVRAASIDRNRELTPAATCRAVIVNSGNANACTGPRGIDDNQRIAELVAAQLGADATQVLVLSTGVIGVPLPMRRIAAGVVSALAGLGSHWENFSDAAEAIMTTDRFAKAALRRWGEGAATLSLAGMAKGAGMIGPRLATLLGVLMTDARLDPADAQAALAAAVAESFNRISVDGHTSTNDAVLLVASGAASPTPLRGEQLVDFQTQLNSGCLELAKMIPADGEGASHVIQIIVTGAANDNAADRIARTIAASPLVKTAIAGNDPNWGRIVSAAGYAGVPFDPANATLRMAGHVVFARGAPADFRRDDVVAALAAQREVAIELELGTGRGRSVHWTSDLTAEYVRINAHYTT